MQHIDKKEYKASANFDLKLAPHFLHLQFINLLYSYWEGSLDINRTTSSS